MVQKKFFIIDTMAMAFRNFHAFGQNQLRNSKGVPTSVVFGCLNFILKIIDEERPDYLVFATDLKEKTFRHELFEHYKAHRSEMPEELKQQVPYLYEMIEIIGSKLLKVPGLEADDLIGSLATQCGGENVKIYIVSGDKDFMQLIGDHTVLLTPQKGGESKLVDTAQVYTKFGCTPAQVTDVLAIMGDASDNVPGVKGIGEKGAKTLIQRYGSLEGVYANLADIANKKQRESLEAARDMAFLSKKLVTIKTDANVGFALDEFCLGKDVLLDNQALIDFCMKLELRSIAARISSHKVTENFNNERQSVEIHDRDYHYCAVVDQQGFDDLLRHLKAAPIISVDTETTGLDIINDRPIGISFATTEKRAFYLPLVREHTAIDLEVLLEGVRPILADTSKLKVGHNIKFDIQMLHNIGVDMAEPLFDTMVMAHLLESSTRNNGLDACCLRYLNYTKISIDSLLDRQKPSGMLDVALDQLTRYACEDADLTLQLYFHLLELLKKHRLVEVAKRVEMPLIAVLAGMEQAGVFVDAGILARLSNELDVMAQSFSTSIYALAGETFNINSSKQLAVILFEKLKIHEQLGMRRIKKTKSGYSTDVSVLEQLAGHPLADQVLKYRTVTKLKNTYVDALPQLINNKTERIHTSFHQTGTATGRLSSSDPNLQNIPVRSDLGREIRQAFRSQKSDSCIISADYSQIELRILAHLAKEQALIEAFIAGADIHRATAAKVFGVALDDVTKEQRSAAKSINFGIVYGMGAGRLARATGMPLNQAKSFIDKYFTTYSGIARYIDSSIAFAKERGYTETICGRRRQLLEIHSKNRMEQVSAQNIATNSPIQGSASDLIKLAMIELNRKIKESSLKLRMLLQVHDELLFECPIDEVTIAEKLIKETMESALTLDVPLLVEVGHGDNWLDAH